MATEWLQLFLRTITLDILFMLLIQGFISELSNDVFPKHNYCSSLLTLTYLLFAYH